MTDLAALRRAQYDEHVERHLPDATGDSTIHPGDQVTFSDGSRMDSVEIYPPVEYAPIVPQPDLHPKSSDSAEVQRLRRENFMLRNELTELRAQPATDAAFQKAFEEAFPYMEVVPGSVRTAQQWSEGAPRGTGSQRARAQDALWGALITLAESGGLDRGSARDVVTNIQYLIDSRT